MNLRRAMVLMLVLAGACSTAAAAPVPDGNWKVAFLSGNNKITYFLIKTETKDDKLNVELLSTSRLQGASLGDVSATPDGQIKIAFKGPLDAVFEGTSSKGDAKLVRGVVTINSRLYPAELIATDSTELTNQDTVSVLQVPPMQKAMALQSRPNVLRAQAQREQDMEKRAQLLKDAAAAAEEARTEAPKLYREVLEKYSDSPAVFVAGQELLRSAGKEKVGTDQVRTWTDSMLKAARPYGARWQAEVLTQIAESLAAQDGLEGLAVDYAQQASGKLAKDAPLAEQIRVYKPLAQALRKSGKEKEAKAAEEVVAKIDAELDKEYKAKVPPFKPEPFAGRKGDSTRAVVMELFTGAQCPPCVAADVAFDALEMSYKPKDLVLIQYHLHIPGPDPLTNAETIARARYYNVNSTPSTFFNGKADAGGGGGMANAQRKYDQYVGIINPLLDTPAGAKLNLTAARQGSKIVANVGVSGIAEPTDDLRLRVLLVEETIRYVGGNNLRFHHQVVRGFLGGVDGIPIKEKETKQTVELDLKELTQRIQTYLDDYAKQRPFPSADRPLDLKNLRVIAIVQNDKTKEILQGVQVDVAQETASK
jgi:hypothetical protein